ncbi:hypothetical protein ACQVP2_33340 [Methylobacterium aquaticum]|uniref:hypothetical protein n=1 Tax=Methylobacterium aquaticum TaxID=270351 RepID=UPI00069D03A5
MCEQAHQQLKEKLGLDHFEGRSRTGLHRHGLMTCLAFAHLQHRRLARTNLMGRGKMRVRLSSPPPPPSLPALRQTIRDRLF